MLGADSLLTLKDLFRVIDLFEWLFKISLMSLSPKIQPHIIINLRDVHLRWALLFKLLIELLLISQVIFNLVLVSVISNLWCLRRCTLNANTVRDVALITDLDHWFKTSVSVLIVLLPSKVGLDYSGLKLYILKFFRSYLLRDWLILCISIIGKTFEVSSHFLTQLVFLSLNTFIAEDIVNLASLLDFFFWLLIVMNYFLSLVHFLKVKRLLIHFLISIRVRWDCWKQCKCGFNCALKNFVLYCSNISWKHLNITNIHYDVSSLDTN